MSHCRASSLYDHLDHCFVVFKDIQHSFLTRRMHVWKNKINIIQIINLSRNFLSCWRFVRVSPFLITLIRVSKNCDDQTPMSQEREYGLTSILRPRKWFLILLNCAKLNFVSYTSNLSEQMYDFQKTHNVPPEVDFESSRSPAKSESWNSPSLQCSALFPTWQYCLFSHVWWM